MNVFFEARDLGYRSPGTQINLLSGVNFSLPEKRCVSITCLVVTKHYIGGQDYALMLVLIFLLPGITMEFPFVRS